MKKINFVFSALAVVFGSMSLFISGIDRSHKATGGRRVSKNALTIGKICTVLTFVSGLVGGIALIGGHCGDGKCCGASCCGEKCE